MQTRLAVKMIADFDEKTTLYDAYGKSLCNLLRELFVEAGISFHSVTYKPSDSDIFSTKLSTPWPSYACVSDISSACWLRVITHFDDDVARVCEILESEFLIDRNSSSNKSMLLKPYRFGYPSAHYLLLNNVLRSEQREYRRFNGLKAKVHVRSIL